MKKLSEFKGEQAVEVIADLLEPIGNICMNEKVQEIVNAENRQSIRTTVLASTMLKCCKSDVLRIMAILNEEPYEEYKDRVNATSLLVDTLNLLNDKELMSLFI